MGIQYEQEYKILKKSKTQNYKAIDVASIVESLDSSNDELDDQSKIKNSHDV